METATAVTHSVASYLNQEQPVVSATTLTADNTKEKVIAWTVYSRKRHAISYGIGEFMMKQWPPMVSDNPIITAEETDLFSLLHHCDATHDLEKCAEHVESVLADSLDELNTRTLCESIYSMIKEEKFQQFKAMVELQRLGRTNPTALINHADPDAELKAYLFGAMPRACFLYRDTASLINYIKLHRMMDATEEEQTKCQNFILEESITRGMSQVCISALTDPNHVIKHYKHRSPMPVLARALCVVEELAVKLTIALSQKRKLTLAHQKLSAEFDNVLKGIAEIVERLTEIKVNVEAYVNVAEYIRTGSGSKLLDIPTDVTSCRQLAIVFDARVDDKTALSDEQRSCLRNIFERIAPPDLAPSQIKRI